MKNKINIQQLNNYFPNYHFEYYLTTDSTNQQCQQLWKKQTDNYCVIAEEQSAGRGRYGNSWQSPPGVNIYLSFSWQNHLSREKPGILSLLFGNIVIQSLIFLYPELQGLVYLKWPNDIYIQEKKLAGILVQSLDAHLNNIVVGIGINVYAKENQIPTTATSLLQHIKINRDKEDNRATIIQEILRLALDLHTCCDEYIIQQASKFSQLSRNIPLTYSYQNSNIVGMLEQIHMDGTATIVSNQKKTHIRY